MKAIFRNKGHMTRLLLLLELTTDPPRDQKDLALRLGITPQAVSDYMNKMKREGLIHQDQGGTGPTVKGTDLLHHDLLSLKEFIDTSIGKLEIIRSTDALALEAIEKGETVHLIMENGLLCALKGKGGSSGVAETEARSGEMLSISSLTGVLEMEPGSIRPVEVRSVRNGGGRETIDKDRLISDAGKGSRNIRSAVLDLEAAALLRRSGMEADLEMPSPETIMNTARRGLDILAFGTPFSISKLQRTIEDSGSRMDISEKTDVSDFMCKNHKNIQL